MWPRERQASERPRAGYPGEQRASRESGAEAELEELGFVVEHRLETVEAGTRVVDLEQPLRVERPDGRGRGRLERRSHRVVVETRRVDRRAALVETTEEREHASEEPFDTDALVARRARRFAWAPR